MALDDLQEHFTSVANENQTNSDSDHRCESNGMWSSTESESIRTAWSFIMEKVDETSIEQLKRSESNSLCIEEVQAAAINSRLINNLVRQPSCSYESQVEGLYGSIFNNNEEKCIEAMLLGQIIHPVHIVGLYNKKTATMRRFETAGDYQIRSSYLTTSLQQLDLSLQEGIFATKNAKCEMYYSPAQKCIAAGTGGLQVIWSNKTILINSPLAPIGKVVQKLRIVSNCTAVVISVDWSIQQWFQQLLNMATNYVILDNFERIFKDGYSMKYRKGKLPSGRVILYMIKTGEETQSSINQRHPNIQIQKNKKL
ncbi:MAG: hypothetical protein EZS28_023271 [Streblomastix strix]|uniref:Uncharacterized protein n=1 Tax=Streblomastix strix TaxID=222440 RepID=A0A5J4VF56_9EUKA|nr:MAG: hypothetical protein EZS28_023271 [Streblomastix strix]